GAQRESWCEAAATQTARPAADATGPETDAWRCPSVLGPETAGGRGPGSRRRPDGRRLHAPASDVAVTAHATASPDGGPVPRRPAASLPRVARERDAIEAKGPVDEAGPAGAQTAAGCGAAVAALREAALHGEGTQRELPGRQELRRDRSPRDVEEPERR